MGLWDEVNTSHHESEISHLVFSSACLFLVGFVCSDEGQIDVNCIELSARKSIYLYKEVKSNQGEIKLISLWLIKSPVLVSHLWSHMLPGICFMSYHLFLALSFSCFQHLFLLEAVFLIRIQFFFWQKLINIVLYQPIIILMSIRLNESPHLVASTCCTCHQLLMYCMQLLPWLIHGWFRSRPWSPSPHTTTPSYHIKVGDT